MGSVISKHLSIAAVFALVTSGAASAAGWSATDGSHELWLTSGFYSHHTAESKAPAGGYNEANSGFGMEYTLNPRWSIAAGQYKNSVYETSHYVQAAWSPDATTMHIHDVRLSLGAALGLVDGYPGMNHGGVFPTLLPVLAVEWKRVGINLTYIPSIAGNVDGAIALQFKFKVF